MRKLAVGVCDNIFLNESLSVADQILVCVLRVGLHDRGGVPRFDVDHVDQHVIEVMDR